MTGNSLRLAGKILVLVKLMALMIYAKAGLLRPRTNITGLLTGCIVPKLGCFQGGAGEISLILVVTLWTCYGALQIVVLLVLLLLSFRFCASSLFVRACCRSQLYTLLALYSISVPISAVPCFAGAAENADMKTSGGLAHGLVGSGPLRPQTSLSV